MDRGTYAAASAGFLQATKLEVVNNNLANVNTPGFKRQYLVKEVQSFEDTLASKLDLNDPFARGDHERTPGVLQVRTITDFSIGSMKDTGNPLHTALQNPNQFFVVSTPEGLQYTRAGNFTLNEEGQVVTAEGFQVQGDGGAIVTNNPGVKITKNGTVSANSGVGTTLNLGQLQVVEFEKPEELERIGGSRFTLPQGGTQPTAVDSPLLIPNTLEMSNVSAVESVIDLITTTKGFELYTKAAKTIDEMNQSAITQVGRKT